MQTLIALVLSIGTPMAQDINVHQSEVIVADDVTGQTITDTQIQAVQDFWLPLLSDPDPTIASQAEGWITITTKALPPQNNPKDRSKCASEYNLLVANGSIQPVA